MAIESARLEGSLAERGTWSADRCTIDRAMRAIGNRSSLLLVREAFYGTRRFDDFARRVGITEAVTAARLRELADIGVLERRPYREPGQRTRHEYVLTDMGRDLLPVALALMQWGDRHLAGPAGPPLRLTHHDCGAPVHVSVHCEAGHDVPLDELGIALAQPGPARPPNPGDRTAGPLRAQLEQRSQS
jgi:DNA-binding HxlR family transcriptional regulator